MFLKNSRYYRLEIVTSRDGRGQEVRLLKLRRLPPTRGTERVVQQSDQLDVISERQYKDSTRFWHIGDANTALESSRLTDKVGDAIEVPER